MKRSLSLVKWAEGIELTRPVGRQIEFRFQGDPGQTVFVAGTFNNWNPKQHRLDDGSGAGSYRIALWLKPGRFEYKFIADDVWCVDPECPDWALNHYGSLNSVVVVD